MSAIARLAEAHIVLLGEIHDNPGHHRFQREVLLDLLQRGRQPALAMEQFDIGQQPAIDRILRSSANEQDKLRALRDAMPQGWDWPLYEPLLALAVQHRLPVVAINLSRDALRGVSRNGFAALGEGEAARLALDTVWNARRDAAMQAEIADGHCGLLPPPAVAAITKAQRARDAAMADVLLAAAGQGQPVVAILGRGHARKDLGVPLYVAARAPSVVQVSIGLMETEKADAGATMSGPPGTSGTSGIASAAPATGALAEQHDLLAFAPRNGKRESDPCASIPRQQSPAS